MDINILKNVLVFMQRTQLAGKEVPAYNDAYKAIEDMILHFENQSKNLSDNANIPNSDK